MKQIDRKFAEKHCDILFASYEMAHEGLDIDFLNTVILSTPKRSITQAIGRIMRKILSDADLKPLIVDISDRLSLFTNQGMSRAALYRKNGYCINEYIVTNNMFARMEQYTKNKTECDNIAIGDIFDETNLSNSSPDKNIVISRVFTKSDYAAYMFDD